MTREEFEHTAPNLRLVMMKAGQDFFGNRTDAEDIAQEGLVRLWHYCERLDAGRNLEALAVRVAKNLCVEHYKRSSGRAGNVLTDCIPAHASDAAEAGLIAGELRLRIDHAMGKLGQRERQLAEARLRDDKPSEEIARETGIPLASVRSMIAMAKKKLRKELDKQQQR